MPSIRSPQGTVNPTTGLPPFGTGGGTANTALAAHIADPTAAHVASAISTANLPAWLSGDTNLASNVQDILAKIITDLTTNDGGASIIYTESPGQWHDSSNIGGSSNLFDLLVDAFQDLSGNNATVKIGGNVINSGVEYGYGAGNIAAGSLRSQLVALMSAANHVFAGGAAWADGSSNGPNTLSTFLTNLLTSLSGTAGAAKIGAAATNGFSAGSVRTQLNEIAPAAAGTAYSAPKTFNGTAGDTNPALVMTSSPSTRKLWFVANSPATKKVRIYITSLGGIEITINAEWSGTDWINDLSSTTSMRYQFYPTTERTFRIEQHENVSVAAWTDSSWDDPCLDFMTSNPAATTTGLTNVLLPKSLIKAWGYVQCLAGTITIFDAVNVTSVVESGGDLVVTLADNMANANYCVIPGNQGASFRLWSATGLTTGSFELSAQDAAGSSVDLGANLGIVSFIVIGAQN